MYFRIAGLLAALSLGAAGYYYVTSLQGHVLELTISNTKQTKIIEDLEFSIDSIRDDILTDRLRADKAYESMKENRKEVSDITKMLSEHDLRKIIQRKPEWFEKISQKGTDKYYSELEELSEWKEQ